MTVLAASFPSAGSGRNRKQQAGGKIPANIKRQLREAYGTTAGYTRVSEGTAVGRSVPYSPDVFFNYRGREYMIGGGKITKRLLDSGTMADVLRMAVN